MNAAADTARGPMSARAISRLHPGNRLRLMAGETLLPQRRPSAAGTDRPLHWCLECEGQCGPRDLFCTACQARLGL